MARSGRIIFVSAGMIAPKKRDHLLARRQLYLNYGALTLATLLTRRGYVATLIHGGHEAPHTFVQRLFARGLLPSHYPIMLSIPSFFALSWAQHFCRLLKELDPDSQIVVGGRWVSGPDPEWLKTLIPEANRIVPGLGEGMIEGALDMSGTRPNVEVVDGSLPPFGLNHHLIDGFEAYQPSIEASRGCGMGCAFCEERAIRLSALRKAELLSDYLVQAHTQYGGEEIRPYVQSSMFVPSVRWASQMREAVRGRGLGIKWRCETRVDAMIPETIEHLAAAGLKVVDLGLETASPTQIGAMKKTQHAERYLRAASDLLAACNRHGVWVKVNVLIYAGETAKTIDETRAWLDHHSSAIKGVSVGPVIVFGPPSTAGALMRELEGHGASAVDTMTAATTGITRIHPSPQIDAQSAEAISLELSRRYMDESAYYDLKSFSYYPRGYTRTDFDADVAASNRETLPFRQE